MPRHLKILAVSGALALAACGGEGIHVDLGSLFGGEQQTVEREPIPDVPATPLPPAPAIGGRTDWSGTRAAAGVDVLVTARDERGWQILWQLVGEPAPAPLPDGAMAVSVFLGPRPTAGYAVEIEDVSMRGDVVVVTYRETRPRPADVVAETLTAPYAVRLVHRTDDTVRYLQEGGEG